MKTPLEYYLEEMPNTPVVPNVSSMKIETFQALMKGYAELYHTEKKKEECHCGGYPDCICNITTHDLKTIDQVRDDYYNRDKLFERK